MDKESIERILSQREIDKTDFIMLFSRKDDCEEDFREAATYTGVRILTDYCRVRGYDAALFLSETDEDYYWILAYSKKDYYSFIESVKKGAELLKERYYFTDELSDNVFILRSPNISLSRFHQSLKNLSFLGIQLFQLQHLHRLLQATSL